MRITALILTLCLGAAPSFAEFMIGADLSGLALLEERGARYFDDGKEQDALAIFKAHGYNTIRLRLFLEADGKWGAVNDIKYTVKLAQRVKQHGFKLLLDLHYSDTWADPGHQSKPKAWEELPFALLKKEVFTYTRSVIYTFKKYDCMPDYVQIGNEITPGMLWPDGQLEWKEREDSKQWEQFTDLLKAGIRGVREIDPKGDTKIVIHIDRGVNPAVTDWFFTHLNEHRVPYDIIGLSYYPWMHGKFQGLETNLEQLGRKFKKDVIIAETAYPYRTIRKKKHELDFPETPEGQRDFLKALTEKTKATPNGHGIGIFYWYPEALPVKDHNTWLGGATALFDSEGHSLPAIGTLAETARSFHSSTDSLDMKKEQRMD
ncbi:glycoside hydrolase family 53 protein [Pontiella sulfatireligans]|uniref:Arabinogalactan endo-beta-1,4-galactanase n=1 Tax=Pontiella sulfatireligans TaxID=2750658 RepID=A0A6C2UP66_9BACT|nr:glycosyl hydrolase 53 family protein [Pontiella sulfatireligans]VGO21869.1 Arabinogalactan endo-beta-1,4-galactanase [Pontiella sulfatireligans]